MPTEYAMQDLEARVVSLERGRRRDRALLGALSATLLALLALGARQSPGADLEDVELGTVTVRALRVLDHQGRLRVLLAEDPADTQRRDRAAGITFYDTTGAERAGLSTFEDLSVVLGLDAPAGVGAPMRDRIGLVVGANGAAAVDLIDNTTSITVRLTSDAEGGGGLEFFDYDLEQREVEITRVNHEGEAKRTMKLGG
jgi:hypothetical protein